MKLLTININSIRAHLAEFLRILESNEYDAVLVQELKCDDASFPHIAFEHLPYNIKTFGQKSWNGVAIFSKLSIEDVTFGVPGFADPNARMIECVLDGKYRIINVYMPNGESIDSPKFPYKIEWMQHFGNHIHKLLKSDEPVILAGDFNVAIRDADVWNPKQYEGSSISAPAARAEMTEWLNAGWRDEYLRFNENEKSPWTWIGYRGGGIHNDHGLRLDYFLTNPAATKRVKNCYIDRAPRMAAKPTDHCGLVLDLM